MPEQKLNPAALGPLYKATKNTLPAVREFGYPGQWRQVRDAITLAERVYDTSPDVPVLAESVPAEQPPSECHASFPAMKSTVVELVVEKHPYQVLPFPPASLPGISETSGAMTMEQAREIAEKILHVVRPQYLRRACVESAIPILIAADHAARRETLKWAMYKTVSAIECRLEELK